jgi:hypothetical protein
VKLISPYDQRHLIRICRGFDVVCHCHLLHLYRPLSSKKSTALVLKKKKKPATVAKKKDPTRYRPFVIDRALIVADRYRRSNSADQTLFPIECIKKTRCLEGKKIHLVKWVGYDDSFNSWYLCCTFDFVFCLWVSSSGLMKSSNCD